MQSTYTFPFVHCISNTPSSAWDEIYEVFGDGHDYDWALVDDDEDISFESGDSVDSGEDDDE